MALAALQVRADIERAHLEQEENRRDAQRNLLLGLIAAVLALGQLMNDPVVMAFLRRLLGLFNRVPLEPMPQEILFAVKLCFVLGVSLIVLGLAKGLGWLWQRVRHGRPS